MAETQPGSETPRPERQHRKHDRPRRMLYHNRRMVEDLLKAFLPIEWVEGVDFTSLSRMGSDSVSPKRLAGRKIGEWIGDVVWQVLRHGRRELVLLVEFQSRSEPFMLVRLVQYVGQFYERLIREEGLKRGDKLPPILVVVLYSGDEPYQEPTSFDQHLDTVPAPLVRYQLGLQHVLIDESRWPREKLIAAGQNAVAVVLRLRQSGPEEIRRLVLEEHLLDWIDVEERQLMLDLLAWFTAVLLPERRPKMPVPEFRSLDELKSFMEEDMETWDEMLLKQGRQEGRQEGQHQGLEMVVVAQSEDRFGFVGEDVRERFHSAADEQLLRWARRIPTAERLEDVFRDD